MDSLETLFETQIQETHFEAIALACLNALQSLDVPRTTKTFSAENRLLSWVQNKASLALFGPLNAFAETERWYDLSLSSEERERAEKLAVTARNARSALEEKFGDGGGRLSALQADGPSEGALSHAPHQDREKA